MQTGKNTDQNLRKEAKYAKEASNLFNDGIWKDSGLDEQGSFWIIFWWSPNVPIGQRWKRKKDSGFPFTPQKCRQEMALVKNWLDEAQAELLHQLHWIHADPSHANVLVHPEGEITDGPFQLIDYGKIKTEVSETPITTFKLHGRSDMRPFFSG